MPINSVINRRTKGFYSKSRLFTPKPIKDAKALRQEDIITSSVEVDGVIYNSDEDSMNRMDRVITVANWKFNQLISSGTSLQDAYKQAYLDNLVPWKLYHNECVQVTIETLCKVQEKALHNLNSLWFKY